MIRLTGCFILLAALSGSLTGCGDANSESNQADDMRKSSDDPQHGKNVADGANPNGGTRRRPAFGGVNDRKQPHANGRRTTLTPAEIAEKLKPLQVIVGEWTGISRNSKQAAREAPSWRWDFSQPKQPALAFESKTSDYFLSGRLTFRPTDKLWELTVFDKDGNTKTFRGDFTVAVHDESDDGKTLQRKFTLTLTQVDPPPKKIEWIYKVEFDQQDNNRYFLILHRKASTRVTRLDTVANQRNGTSFAAKLDDYGDKTCVVSQGLGTMPVSHEGRTYYVCCSGCKQAFEAEPEKWIAAFEEWKRNNKKNRTTSQ